MRDVVGALVRALLGVLLLTVLLFGGLYWWLFLKDAPGNQPLDAARWRATPATVAQQRNPRRNMVRSARRWLARERPARAEVHAALGPPDGLDRGVDSWQIGCGFTSIFCVDGEALVVEYRAGRASGSRFVQY